MASWGCPHEIDGKCTRINNLPCDPGMKGCVLAGRFRFSNEAKNRPPRRAPAEGGGQAESSSTDAEPQD